MNCNFTCQNGYHGPNCASGLGPQRQGGINELQRQGGINELRKLSPESEALVNANRFKLLKTFISKLEKEPLLTAHSANLAIKLLLEAFESL